MANFEGFQPQAIPRFGSLVQSDDTTELPYGVARAVQNCRFRAQSVGPRDGIAVKLKFGAAGNSIGGFGLLRYLADDNSGVENIQIIAGTRTDGNVWAALPFSQASVQQLTTDDMLAAAGLSRGKYQGLWPQVTQAYNKSIVAMGDGTKGVARPLIINGSTLTCDPLSDKAFGDTWQPATQYRVGHVVSPSTDTGNVYRCIQGGITAVSEPTWPTDDASTVVDGTGVGNVIWQKLTVLASAGLQTPRAPIISSSAAGNGTIPAGATVFLACTWSNEYGETSANVVNPDGSMGAVLQWKNNTGAAADLTVSLPLTPSTIRQLAAQYGVTSCNVYSYVANGTPDPNLYLDATSYAYLGSGDPGALFTVSTIPIGQQIPQVNTAFLSPEGNVSSGVRYMLVLFMSRTGYICGFSAPAPIRCDISADGRQMLVQDIPIGPYNCAARILAFTVAGAGSAGPYFYIAEDDFEDPGLGQAKILQTATKIPDNVTTAAYFDFSDSYLPGASEVTDYFDRIEVPPFSDACFSKSLNRVAYAGAQEYPSALLISDLEDAEAVRVPGSIVNVSVTDGDRVVCMRDFGSTHIAYKENSAHTIVPNDGDPSDWDTEERWTGSGPCGPRAIDVCQGEGEKIHAYAHRTGGYVYTGGPAPNWVTKELTGTPQEPGIWDRINWACSYLIRTTINPKEREVYFYVPLDAATTNSHRIVVNYQNGWDEPIVFVVRSGREVPNINGRKWSLDNVAANDCQYVPQRTSV